MRTPSQILLVLLVSLLNRAVTSKELALLMGTAEHSLYQDCLALHAQGFLVHDEQNKHAWLLGPSIDVQGELTPFVTLLEQDETVMTQHKCLAKLYGDDPLTVCGCFLKALCGQKEKEQEVLFAEEQKAASICRQSQYTLLLVECILAALKRFVKSYRLPMPLDGRVVTLLFPLQYLCMDSRRLLNSVMQLAHKAFSYARKTGNERFAAMLSLSRVYIHIFLGINSEKIVQQFAADLEKLRLYESTPSDLVTIFEGFLAYFTADFRKSIECFYRCPEKVPWYLTEVRNLFVICSLFSASYLRQFYFAMGCLESLRVQHKEGSVRPLTFFYEVNSLFTLLRMGEMKRARALFNTLLSVPECLSHIGICSIALRALALYHFLQGDVAKAYLLLKRLTVRFLKQDILPTAFKDPLILDMLFVFTQVGYKPIPYYEFETTLARLVQGANRQLRGAALRIQALQLVEKEQSWAKALPLLQQSFELLLGVGDAQQAMLSMHYLAQALSSCGQEQEGCLLHEKIQRLLKKDLRGKSYQEALQASLHADHLMLNSLSNEDIDELSSSQDEQLLSACEQALALLQEGDGLDDHELKVLHIAQELFQAEQTALFSIDETNKPLLVHALNLFEQKNKSLEQLTTWFTEVCSAKQEAIVYADQDICLRIPSAKQTWLLYLGHSNAAWGKISPMAARCLGYMLGAELRLAKIATKVRTEERSLRSEITSSLLHSEGGNDFSVISAGLALMMAKMHEVALTDVPILITGETGVGKELMARHIHSMSGRKGPFVAVNPASMGEELFASEFFGHEKGSFTGAERRKIGFFELADQGTLFIDEIGEMPLSMQIKLLRTLQDYRFMRVGGTEEISSRFRLISATNRDLQEAVQRGTFRQDLLYRISVVPVRLPALRERPQDILPLVRSFIELFCKLYEKDVPVLSMQEQEKLLRYRWPGNVRELRNLVERAIILLGIGKELHFPIEAQSETLAVLGQGQTLDADFPSLDELERRYLQKVLQHCGGKVRGDDGAAKLLRININTLYARLRKHGLITKSFQPRP